MGTSNPLAISIPLTPLNTATPQMSRQIVWLMRGQFVFCKVIRIYSIEIPEIPEGSVNWTYDKVVKDSFASWFS